MNRAALKRSSYFSIYRFEGTKKGVAKLYNWSISLAGMKEKFCYILPVHFSTLHSQYIIVRYSHSTNPLFNNNKHNSSCIQATFALLIALTLEYSTLLSIIFTTFVDNQTTNFNKIVKHNKLKIFMKIFLVQFSNF